MALRSGVGIIKDLDEEKGKKKTVERTVRGSKIKSAPVEEKEVGGLTSAVAGVGSGLVKTVEGVVSLGAELMDLGAGQLVGLPSTKGSTINAAEEVEEFFDTLNVFEETAEARATGKLTQALVQIGVPGTAGAKLTLAGANAMARKLAQKAIKAKKAGNYANVMSSNAQKGIKKAAELNKLTGKKRFSAIVLGGAAGETLVGDTEEIGTFGDVFEAGPTRLDREKREDPSEDAVRKLMNRTKFASESVLLTPFVYGVGAGAKALAKKGKELAYSSSAIARGLDKFGAVFRPRSGKPEEVFLSKMKENARKMADTNFSMEQVGRIDKITDKYFPATKSFLDRTSETGRKEFLEDLDKTLFKGDLNKEGLDKILTSKLLKSMNKVDMPTDQQSIIFKGLKDTRQKFKELLEITAGGPVGKMDLPAGVAVDLRALMGKRIKNYIGNTYELFQNKDAGLFNKFKPAREDKDFVVKMFMRYAAKNKNPINKFEAESMVDDIMNSARNMDPKKDTLPTFSYQNLTKSADDAYNIKTFAQTLTKETAGGDKTLQVIGKGSKAFRKLFGEIDDVRHSIFEGVNRLSVTARKNQMIDEILDTDELMKSTLKASTPPGQRGFFHSTPLEARRAFGDIPGEEIVKIDPYVKEYFTDGLLVNRLSGSYTTKAIAESFSNVSKLQEFMRGDTGGSLGKTFSWAWRNLLLTPKAGAQYAKTILSIPTHIRNFLSSGAFALGNGTLFENPQLMKEAMQRAGATIQLGIRNPLAMERYRRYLELGVTNTNTRIGDLRNLMKDIRFGEGNLATDSILKPMLNSLGALGRGTKKIVGKGAKVMQDAYIAEDDFWKVFNFEVEYGRIFSINKSKQLKLSNEVMEEMAAKIVRNTVPNYAYVGDLVKTARMTPFGNFMSWPSEVYRTGAGIVKQGLEEIADPITKKINPITSTNPMKGVGMKRLVGMGVATAVLPYGVIKGSQAIFGVTNEEADAANDFVAPWAKDSQKIYMRDPETNELYYIDYSKNNVYDTLTRPFQTILRNIQEGIEDEEILLKGFAEGIAQAAGNIAEPFVSESMFTEAFMDVYSRNGMTNDGVELYSDQTPEAEKYQRIFKHLGKTLMPTIKPFQRLSKAITKTPGSTGEMYEISKEMAGIMGWKPVKVEPERALGFYIYDFQRGISKARKEFTGGPEGLLKGGPKTPQAVVERLFVANQASFKVQKQMLTHFINAQKIGLSRSKIKKSLTKRGIPESTIDDLLKGNFKFFFPSEKIQDRFKEVSRDTGTPNPFLQARGVIKAMRNVFRGMSLYGNFNMELSDFMPATSDDQSSNIQTPPLPLTPMPTKTVQNTSVKDPITNLTRTEDALLSQSDKIIASRT